MQHFVRRSTSLPFRRFWGDVRREFVQRLSVAVHGTMGSYLRDALQEGSADDVACLPCSSGLGFFFFSSFCLVASTAFSCKIFFLGIIYDARKMTPPAWWSNFIGNFFEGELSVKVDRMPIYYRKPPRQNDKRRHFVNMFSPPFCLLLVSTAFSCKNISNVFN
jgi:hypothetical protein